MQKLPLSNGGFTLVDDDVFEQVWPYTWRRDSYGYVTRATTVNRRDIVIKLHNIVIGDAPKPLVVDHISGDKLDNRRKNLRFASQRLNHLNRRDLTGIYQEIVFDRRYNRRYQYWRVRLDLGDRKTISISGIKNEAEARSIAALLRGALIYHELTKGQDCGIG
jgi:hypothetical protein